MKYRGSGKIKKKHGMIRGLKKLLESIEDWPEIHAITPGRIERSKTGGLITLKVQYETTTGLKAIANAYGGVQEIFFVTNQPKTLWDKLKKLED